MEINEIVSKIDHTYLSGGARWADVMETCDDAIAFGAASVCIPPCFVKAVKNYCRDSVKICSVVGFPCGYNSLMFKVGEAVSAASEGADEIDMVINVGALKSKDNDFVAKEIAEVKNAIGSKTLKVIIETGLLNKEEKIRACKIITDSGADFIKTSTGFFGGATEEDILLIKENIAPSLKIKASGGIKTLQQAEKFILLGSDRIGSSSVIKNLKK